MYTPMIFGLPDTVDICGHKYPIRTDFRIGIKFEQMFDERSLNEDEQIAVLVKALALWFPQVPTKVSEAIEAMLWFYRCGEDISDHDTDSNSRIYDLRYDEAYLHAAFLTQYDIDLYSANLHWWEFSSLFKALDECRLTQIIGYRSVKIDPSNMSKSEQEFYRKMKKKYALPLPDSEKQRTDELEAALMSGVGIEEALAKKR